MLLAQVVGTVVASRKEPLLEGFKLMAVQPVDIALRPAGVPLVAVDSVGAGPGEFVLLVAGSSARYTAVTSGKPADLTILAIVDQVEFGGQLIYNGSEAGRTTTSRDPSGPVPGGAASARSRRGGA